MSDTLYRYFDRNAGDYGKHVYRKSVCDTSCEYYECYHRATGEFGVYCNDTFYPRCKDAETGKYKVTVGCCNYEIDCAECSTGGDCEETASRKCQSLDCSSPKPCYCLKKYVPVVLQYTYCVYLVGYQTITYYDGLAQVVSNARLTFQFYWGEGGALMTFILRSSYPTIDCYGIYTPSALINLTSYTQKEQTGINTFSADSFLSGGQVSVSYGFFINCNPATASGTNYFTITWGNMLYGV